MEAKWYNSWALWGTTERSLKIEQWKLRETFKLRDNLMYKDGTLKILLSLDTQNEVIY